MYRFAVERLGPQYRANLNETELRLLLCDLATVLAVAYFTGAGEYIIAREKT